jgi:hypothetical protein
VSINGKGENMTADITATGPVKLEGVKQTAPTTALAADKDGNVTNAAAAGALNPNALQLKLVVRVGGSDKAHDTVKSEGFAVTAIPLNYTEAKAGEIYTANGRGLIVQDGWSSDGGDPTTVLDQVGLTELVEVPLHGESGLLIGLGGGMNSGYLRATSFSRDGHGTGVSDIDALYKINRVQTGHQIVYQTNAFLDFRMGVINIPMPNSGFAITRDVSVKNGKFYLTTTKYGLAVTANGIASGAGSIIGTSPLKAEDQFVENVPPLPHVRRQTPPVAWPSKSGVSNVATLDRSASVPVVRRKALVSAESMELFILGLEALLSRS